MNNIIPALLPHDETGHQFVIYADSCSGIPGTLHESTFAAVNAVIQRLEPQPEFICFPGDEIIGLTPNETYLREQWAYWFEHEMKWLDFQRVPFYPTTANHTTYDALSEKVFQEVWGHLPRNGPSDQPILSYFVRRGNLLMVFINTAWSGLGGEGNVETEWLAQVLEQQTDAEFKLVIGHHPIIPANGFTAEYQRQVNTAAGNRIWELLVQHKVLAYVCSHMLAFDVQVRQGVLQIMTAGAGTAYRMPESEYLHAMQAALDSDGLRYQVLDTEGVRREWLTWPLTLPPVKEWGDFSPSAKTSDEHLLRAWQVSAQAVKDGSGAPQTLFCGWTDDKALPQIWVGLTGIEQKLTVMLQPKPNNSPHYWYGPALNENLDIQFAIHDGMGAGGLMWRWDGNDVWSSLTSASAWGIENIPWPEKWRVGYAQNGVNDRPFRGKNLVIKQHEQIIVLK